MGSKARAHRSPLWFSSLELSNWRNFRHVEVDLQRRLFLVGPNAAGKSNFLDLFRFLEDIVAVGGGLQEALRRRGGVSRVRSLAARRNPDIGIRVEVASSRGIEWEYSLSFRQDKQKRAMVTREQVVKDGTEILDRPNKEDRKDPERLTQTYLEQVNVNRQYRRLSEFFDSVSYLHIVPQLVREPDRSVGRRNDPFGGDFLEQVAGTSERTRNARLRRIKEALRVAVPQLEELELVRDDRGTPHLRGKYEHWRPQGAWQNEDQFSDGTLRLMGLLWAVLQGSGPLLLEEPELSLHPDVVRVLPQLFARIQRKSGRQLLVSTHSISLLQDDGIGMNEVLLLLPDAEGTQIKAASELREVKALLEGGLTMADAVLPRTRPRDVSQLALFEQR